MGAIADALVYAVAFINCRPTDGLESDYDCGALESIAAMLDNRNPGGEDALAAAAERALEAERSAGSPRPEFLQLYSCWMEDMFGDGWHDNCRVLVDE